MALNLDARREEVEQLKRALQSLRGGGGGEEDAIAGLEDKLREAEAILQGEEAGEPPLHTLRGSFSAEEMEAAAEEVAESETAADAGEELEEAAEALMVESASRASIVAREAEESGESGEVDEEEAGEEVEAVEGEVVVDDVDEHAAEAAACAVDAEEEEEIEQGIEQHAEDGRLSKGDDAKAVRQGSEEDEQEVAEAAAERVDKDAHEQPGPPAEQPEPEQAAESVAEEPLGVDGASKEDTDELPSGRETDTPQANDAEVPPDDMMDGRGDGDEFEEASQAAGEQLEPDAQEPEQEQPEQERAAESVVEEPLGVDGASKKDTNELPTGSETDTPQANDAEVPPDDMDGDGDGDEFEGKSQPASEQLEPDAQEPEQEQPVGEQLEPDAQKPEQEQPAGEQLEPDAQEPEQGQPAGEQLEPDAQEPEQGQPAGEQLEPDAQKPEREQPAGEQLELDAQKPEQEQPEPERAAESVAEEPLGVDGASKKDTNELPTGSETDTPQANDAEVPPDDMDGDGDGDEFEGKSQPASEQLEPDAQEPEQEQPVGEQLEPDAQKPEQEQPAGEQLEPDAQKPEQEQPVGEQLEPDAQKPEQEQPAGEQLEPDAQEPEQEQPEPERAAESVAEEPLYVERKSEDEADEVPSGSEKEEQAKHTDVSPNDIEVDNDEFEEASQVSDGQRAEDGGGAKEVPSGGDKIGKQAEHADTSSDDNDLEEATEAACEQPHEIAEEGPEPQQPDEPAEEEPVSEAGTDGLAGDTAGDEQAWHADASPDDTEVDNDAFEEASQVSDGQRAEDEGGVKVVPSGGDESEKRAEQADTSPDDNEADDNELQGASEASPEQPVCEESAGPASNQETYAAEGFEDDDDTPGSANESLRARLMAAESEVEALKARVRMERETALSYKEQLAAAVAAPRTTAASSASTPNGSPRIAPSASVTSLASARGGGADGTRAVVAARRSLLARTEQSLQQSQRRFGMLQKDLRSAAGIDEPPAGLVSVSASAPSILPPAAECGAPLQRSTTLDIKSNLRHLRRRAARPPAAPAAGQLAADVERLRAEVAERDGRLTEAAQQSEALKHKLAALRRRERAMAARLGMVKPQRDPATRVAALEAEVKNLRSHNVVLQQKQQASAGEVHRLRAAVAAADAALSKEKVAAARVLARLERQEAAARERETAVRREAARKLERVKHDARAARVDNGLLKEMVQASHVEHRRLRTPKAGAAKANKWRLRTPEPLALDDESPRSRGGSATGERAGERSLPAL